MSFPLGSISSGTLRPEDLLPTFIDELIDFAGETRLVEEAKRFVVRGDWTDEEAEWLVEEIIEALQEFAPPFVYFGAHADDPADFGWWVDFDALYEAIDWAERDEFIYLKEEGLVVNIEDQGNISLYTGSQLLGEELWAT